MQQMTLSELGRLNASGAVLDVRVICYDASYSVGIVTVGGDYMLATYRGDVRRFASIDTAFAVLRRYGCRHAKLWASDVDG